MSLVVVPFLTQEWAFIHSVSKPKNLEKEDIVIQPVFWILGWCNWAPGALALEQTIESDTLP